MLDVPTSGSFRLITSGRLLPSGPIAFPIASVTQSATPKAARDSVTFVEVVTVTGSSRARRGGQPQSSASALDKTASSVATVRLKNTVKGPEVIVGCRPAELLLFHQATDSPRGTASMLRTPHGSLLPSREGRKLCYSVAPSFGGSCARKGLPAAFEVCVGTCSGEQLCTARGTN